MRILIGLLLFAAPVLHAQTMGTITGDVYDQSGKLLAGASVTALHRETSLERTAKSDARGSYVISLLPPGAYELRVSLDGFQSIVVEGVTLSVAERLHVHHTLELGTVQTEVTVSAGAPLVNTSTSELSYLVDDRTMRELPLNGRNYTDLALLQPGVVAFPNRESGSIVAHGLAASVNGQDPRSNVYLLDGTIQNDFTNGPAGSAAGTVLGVETIREFRVEVNAYSAQYGRNMGGQINALTKSGANDLHGSAFYFHRNDNLDARNFFDFEKPEFRRHQYGGTLGGPIRPNKTFFFAGYEGLRSDTGRTINTVTMTEEARQGPVNPAVQPYLDEFPLPNGRNLGGGLGEYVWGFDEEVNQDFLQGRVDQIINPNHQLFARYTFDDARQSLPTDFPQFPRSFLSRNQFATVEWSAVISPATLNTLRTGFSRTNIGQDVAVNTRQALAPFVPGRAWMGDIDIGGIPRFGPQISIDVNLVQNVFSLDESLTLVRGRHTIRLGGIVERYQDNMVNPTFSNGVYIFGSVQNFLANRPARFIGLTPEGQFDRYWRFTLFGGYVQDDWKVNRFLTLNLGLRYETTSMPKDIYGRDSTLLGMMDAEPSVGQLYDGPSRRNIAPRFGFAWDVLGSGSLAVRGGYGWFYNTNNQQNLIVTVTNPPFTPRIVQGAPPFPQPDFARSGSVSFRPVDWKIKDPNVHMWNLNVQKMLPANILLTAGYAGARGVHLFRNGDVNLPQPERLDDGTLFWSAASRRPNAAYSAIELKRSDGNSWYNAAIVEVRKRFTHGVNFQFSYTFGRTIDTTQGSTFFSDSNNGTTSAFPEFEGFSYNKGRSDFHAKHNWVFNFSWDIPFAGRTTGAAKTLLDGWELSGILNHRSGQPLTTFVQGNRSRSQWAPSLAPGQGFDRPSLAPGFTHEAAVTGDPNQWFSPNAFALQPAGTLGNLGRGTFDGPNLRAYSVALLKNFRVREAATIQFRAEFFNLANRANFGTPALQAYSGVSDNEMPLSSFGRIRTTMTEARQIQLGLKILF